ncbi:MINDY deubiquitinase domain [Dillenia turbinata]|uniref:MINDY deubiquitinase domain n=1 Tax=Dillenia turbinata TaxID=194707 RepID=A0AAN8VHS4_9MAGN
MSSEERKDEAGEAVGEKECLYKTKVIQFLGRTTPIVLQNDNGPCPLLAICNVLSLKNNLNLNPDAAEVSQEKLLSLVAERLIDSNSNVNNKDAGFVENQQQNIADAIDLLPRLATGIDVNIKFRRIDDFEFTPECAIFDLLDIPLYHGWIVDPQDYETASAVGSKSYNALTGELVALETRNMGSQPVNNPEEDSVDFAAATTATLGVPSPSLSRARSFGDSPCSVIEPQKARKGDIEEEAEVLRALKLSENELPTPVPDSSSVCATVVNMSATVSDESTCMKKTTSVFVDSLEGNIVDDYQNSHNPTPFIADDCSSSKIYNNDQNLISLETTPLEAVSPLINEQGSLIFQPASGESEECFPRNNAVVEAGAGTLVPREGAPLSFSGTVSMTAHGEDIHDSQEDKKELLQSTSGADIHEQPENPNFSDAAEISRLSSLNADSDSSSGRRQHLDVTETFSSSVDDSEPIYEGEECILESGTTLYESSEPMYEGEVVLAAQADKSSVDSFDASSKVDITPQQGELIENFLKSTASQLTIYGLFCLQDGLKERELCVFFRNNHFCTMFKFDGELYLLATDQGYINQPDLVWEKLNEVNGDTVFYTGNFKEFKVDDHSNSTWDEQNAMASTADYLASIDNSAQSSSNFSSDLQLAIALQQQEFEQQPQRNNLQQPSAVGSTRLITGPQMLAEM